MWKTSLGCCMGPVDCLFTKGLHVRWREFVDVGIC